MKLNNLSLPHPVLGQSDDITAHSEISEPTIVIGDTSYLIEFEISYDNGTIADLVKFDKALYCCEVTCPGTLYRELFTFSETKIRLSLDRSILRNKVNFQVYCLSKGQISNYSNPAAHADYEGFVFELEKADLLANLGSFSFNADIEYHKLKAASSFMEIIPHSGQETETDYVFDSKKIQIKLPKEAYEKFRHDFIGKNKEYAAIIHASLVQNALTVALYNYEKSLEMGNCVWAESIEHRLRDEQDLNNGSSKFDLDQIPKLVQKLLGNPNNRMIESLEKLSKTQHNETE